VLIPCRRTPSEQLMMRSVDADKNAVELDRMSAERSVELPNMV